MVCFISCCSFTVKGIWFLCAWTGYLTWHLDEGWLWCGTSNNPVSITGEGAKCMLECNSGTQFIATQCSIKESHANSGPVSFLPFVNILVSDSEFKISYFQWINVFSVSFSNMVINPHHLRELGDEGMWGLRSVEVLNEVMNFLVSLFWVIYFLVFFFLLYFLHYCLSCQRWSNWKLVVH